MSRKRVRSEKESIVDLFGDVVQDRASYLYSIAEDEDEALRLAREPAPRPDPANANGDLPAPAPAPAPERPRPTSPLGGRARPRRAPADAAAPGSTAPGATAPDPGSDTVEAKGGEGHSAMAAGGSAQSARHLDRLRRARLARARAEQSATSPPRDAWPDLKDDRGLWSAVTIVHGALSVLSLGLYRPWMKTETRRVLWSHVEADGERLEYLGTGAQLFRGLMLALILLGGVIALAWLAAATLGMMSLELVSGALQGTQVDLDNPVGAALPLLGAIAAPALIAALMIAPLLPLAAFRGRRYRLSRTRWKGVRFGMDGGGWGLMGLGLVWTPLVIASGGLLWPVWRWLRERRMTRAMRWGGEPFGFEGGPLPLLLRWLPAWGFFAALVAVGGALVLGLVGVANHDNVGGIFRNAAAFGVGAVLIDGATCDPLYRKAIRVSVGGTLKVPFVRVADAAAMLDALEASGTRPLALSPRGTSTLEDVAMLQGRRALLLGAEGPGLPAAVMARCRTVRIDMAAGFDSLNVATSAGIALYAVSRGR